VHKLDLVQSTNHCANLIWKQYRLIRRLFKHNWSQSG